MTAVHVPRWPGYNNRRLTLQPRQHYVSVLNMEDQKKRLLAEKDRCELRNAKTPITLTGTYCNRTWDNVVCWSDTPAGHVATQPCPHYINMFDQGEVVTKRCTENGTWWVNPLTDQPWSNFSACIKLKQEKVVPQLIEEHMPGVKLMYTIGYSLSLTTLILALSIMVYFKRLHCARNIIHMNMFLAFGLRAVFSLLKNMLLVNDLGFVNDVNQTGSEIEFVESGTHWECKLFFTLFYYIIFASVMWLFNEGLYLQLILYIAVFSDKTRLEWFLVLGWGIPLCFVLPWVVCRVLLDDMLCWNVHVYKSLYWILHAPMVASVAINFVIFINIIRMLFTKLRAANCSESKMFRYRKLAKSTLILIPLFAVYYMIFIWLPDDINPTAELFKMYVEMLFNSFQGFLVALLFCFLNHEVQYELRKTWNRHLSRQIGGRRNTLTNHSLFGSTTRDYHSRDTTKRRSKLCFKIIKRTSYPLSDIAEEPVLGPSADRQKARLVHQHGIDLDHLQQDNSLVAEGADGLTNHRQESGDRGTTTPDKAFSAGSLLELNDLDFISTTVVISNSNLEGSLDLLDGPKCVLREYQNGDVTEEPGFLHNKCAMLYVNNKTWSSELENLANESTSPEVRHSYSLNNGLVTCNGKCVI